MKKVGVIIPVYNVEAYLRECLDSVFSQSMIKEMEVVCVNDGSDDNSKDILLEYEKRYENLLLVNISNHGVGYARNIGLKLADSEAVCFMDPDDMYATNTVIERLYTELVDNKVNICGGSAKILRDGVIETGVGDNEKFNFYKNGLVKFDDYQYSYGFWRFMFKKDFLEQKNIIFPLYSRFQDPPFLVKAMIESGEFYAISDVVYIYRANFKKVQFTYKKTKDCLCGIIDVMKMSYEKGMQELNVTCIRHINNWFCNHLLRNIVAGHLDLLEMLDEVHKNSISDSVLDVEIKLQKYESARDYCELLKNRIRQFSKLIIYGAGDFGKKFADFSLQQENFPELVLAVTKSCGQEGSYKGIRIMEIDELVHEKERALVLIATREDTQRLIRRELVQRNFKNIIGLDSNRFQVYYWTLTF